MQKETNIEKQSSDNYLDIFVYTTIYINIIG